MQEGGERVSWEGRGGFRLGFSHSLLSPQAWVFLRYELGGGCIRAELAEGEVCLAREGEEGGLLRHHNPLPLFRSGSFPREMSQRTGVSLEWGLALAPHRGVSK